MIDEDRTMQLYGYYSADLKPKSHKPIVKVCDNCGTYNIVDKSDYSDLCYRCIKKGTKLTEEHKRKIGKSGKGRKCSDITKQKMSKAHKGRKSTKETRIIISCGKQGINRKDWCGFAREQSYCDKWTENLRKEIREKYDNCDYISGLPNYVCNVMNDKVWNLDVHHIDFDKDQGCNDKKFNLIPLSKVNHSKINKNKSFWNRLFNYSLKYDKEYYLNNKVNIWEMI